MKLTPERLFGRKPLPGTAVPTQLKVSADGRYGSCLLAAEDDRERLELWLVDMASAKARRLLTGTATASEDAEESREERDGRERRRQFSRGISAYEWHPRKHEVLFPANGGGWLLPVADGTAGEARQVTPPGTRQSGIRYSAQGNFVSYVRDGDLYCLDVADGGGGEGGERRLTHDGGGAVSNGLADFIAQEEMHRFDGHWWSPDESYIAFTRVDEAPIPEMHRHEVHADGIRVVPQRYPFAGGANAEVRLGLLNVANGEVAWLDWAVEADDYLARVQFAPDGALYVQAQSRNQRRLTLRRFMFGRWGRCEEVLEERSETWVNLHDNLTFLANPDGRRQRFLWTSERSGFSQLLLQGPDGEERWLADYVEVGIARGNLRQGPDGKERWLAGESLAVNRVLQADKRCAWVTGWNGDPTTRHLYQVEYEGMASCRHEDVQDAAMHPASNVGLVLQSGGLANPSMLCVRDEAGQLAPVQLDSRQLGVADVRATCSLAQVRGPSVERISRSTLLPSSSTLYGRLTKPSPCLANRRYPVIVNVYGGPGVQRVRNELPPLALQLFAQAGFGVFELDNRGGSGRHKAFEDAIHGRLGHAEVEDQLAGVEFLRQQEWVAADRIGIFGHSYGGYMVLMCLAASHVFRAGVAVAPVTDWTLYDTHYTERYLGTPEDNPKGYEASSPLPRAADIDAPLLLMHGMADDNVLFTHTLKLVKALQDAARPFELMTYPGAKHALQERNVAIHRYRCILSFFRRHLGPIEG